MRLSISGLGATSSDIKASVLQPRCRWNAPKLLRAAEAVAVEAAFFVSEFLTVSSLELSGLGEHAAGAARGIEELAAVGLDDLNG
jgi:hypothetical protein